MTKFALVAQWVKAEIEYGAKINKQVTLQVTKCYPQTIVCSLLAQYLMDFDKLYLNEFPPPTTQPHTMLLNSTTIPLKYQMA